MIRSFLIKIFPKASPKAHRNISPKAHRNTSPKAQRNTSPNLTKTLLQNASDN